MIRSMNCAVSERPQPATREQREKSPGANLCLFCRLSQTAEKLQLGVDHCSNGTRELLEQKEPRSSYHWCVFHAPHSPGTLSIIPAKLLLPCLWETDLESNSLSLTTVAVIHHESLESPGNSAGRRTLCQPLGTVYQSTPSRARRPKHGLTNQCGTGHMAVNGVMTLTAVIRHAKVQLLLRD